MNNHHAMFLYNEQRRHEAALSSWVNQVCSCRDLSMALRLARHAPSAGAVLSGMRHLTNDPQSRAVQQIDAFLTQRLKQSDAEQKYDLLRLARGMPQFRNLTAWVVEETRRYTASSKLQAG